MQNNPFLQIAAGAVERERQGTPVVASAPTVSQPFVPSNNAFLDSINNRIDKQTKVQDIVDNGSQNGYLGGFLESTISSVPELFGVEATPEAQAFRINNPVSGFATQLVGGGGVYGAAFKLSRVPKVAAALDASVARLGITAASSPIVAGVVRETVRYAPLELSRLGAGLVLTDTSEDYGNLLADVGINTLLTGGLGGIGGFFRAGGKITPKRGEIPGSDVGLLPTFEFRLGLDDAGQIAGDVERQQIMHSIKQEVFDSLPVTTKIKGEKVYHVNKLEAGDGQTEGLLNQLFSPQLFGTTSKQIEKRGLDVRTLSEGLDSDVRTLNKGQQQQFATLAGFESVDQLAANVVYPRIARVATNRAAGNLAKTFDNASAAGAFTKLSDGVYLGKETDGLFVFAKRISEGALKKGQKAAGAVKSKTDDVWLVGKTDKPQNVVGESGKLAEGTVKEWAKYVEPFRRVNDSKNVFRQVENDILEYITPADWNHLGRVSPREGKSYLRNKLSKTIKESGTVDSVVKSLYNVFQPTLFKQVKDPVYGRLFGLLSGSMQAADSIVSKIIKGKVKIQGTGLQAIRGKNIQRESVTGFTPVEDLVRGLTQGEVNSLAKVINARKPAEAAEEIIGAGVSPKLKQAIEELQGINKMVLDDVVLPALDEAGLRDKFKVLEGYIGPRVYKGDFFLEVTDSNGHLRWLTSGSSPAAAQAEAKAIVDAAAERGLKWKQGKTESKAVRANLSDQKDIDQLMELAMNTSDDVMQVIERGISNAERGAKKAAAIGLPKNLTTARTGVRGSPDLAEYTADEVIKSINNHYSKIARYSAYVSWKTRWEELAKVKLKPNNRVAFEDLQKKAGQFLGIEGPITNVLNKTLSPLAPLLGGEKAATRIAAKVNALLYDWTLGFGNLSFALLNYTTPLQTVYPWLHYVTKAPADDVGRMMVMSPRYGSNGKAIGTMGTVSPRKIFGESMLALKNPSDELRAMWGEAMSDGTIANSASSELMGATAALPQTLRETLKKDGGFKFITESLRYMANNSEQFSRMIAFNSAYLVGKRMYGMQGDALYQWAKKGTEVTMFGYRVVDRSNAFTGPLGSTFGLFKNWQFHFINSMAHYAGVGMRDGVWAPLLWQGGAALGLAGLGGIPLKTAADGLARWHSDSPTSFHWLQENWGDSVIGNTSVGDAVYYGLPAFLGVSLQSSASVPGTDVKNEINSLMSSVVLERGKQAAAAMGAAADHWGTVGENPLRNDKVRAGLVGALTPRAMARIYQATEGDKIRSLRNGNPLLQDASDEAKLVHGLGFNSLELARIQTASNELYEQRESDQNKIDKIGTAYAQAEMAGDYERMDELLKVAEVSNVPLDSVMRSAANRVRRQEEGDALTGFQKQKAFQYIDAISE